MFTSVLLLFAIVLLLPLLGLEPPMMEVMAAARAAVKLGSAVMAAVAALRVSVKDGCCCSSFGNEAASILSRDICSPENFDWLYPKT